MMKKHPMLACASALLLATVACVDADQGDAVQDEPAANAGAAAAPAAAPAEQAKPAAPAAQSPAAPPAQAPAAAPTKFVPPIRGQAELGILRPVTKREGKEVVTVIKVKNLSTTGSIAGLKLDEFWYDKAGNPVTGDTYRHRKPLLPEEVIEITLRTPVDPKMHQNQYNFSHANGTIKAKTMPKF
jgi:hypothetical protein